MAFRRFNELDNVVQLEVVDVGSGLRLPSSRVRASNQQSSSLSQPDRQQSQ